MAHLVRAELEGVGRAAIAVRAPHGNVYWTFVFYNGLRYIKYDSIAKFSRELCVHPAA
jgi:hypothetical protein